MNDEMIEFVARELATLDGVYYWKYSYPEDERDHAEYNYKKEARRFITAFEAIQEMIAKERND